MKGRKLDTSGEAGPHQVYDWRGSAFEIGFQHGKTLRDEIVAEAKGAIEKFARRRGWSESKALEFALSEWEPVFRSHTPRAIEEIKGIAKGGGFDYARAFFAAVHGGTKSAAPQRDGCTAFACGKNVTEGGKVLLGQTKDTAAPLTRYRITRLAYTDSHACILLNYPGWLTHMGLSAQGLACTGNSLSARQPSVETNPITFLRRLAMEKDSVDDVLAVVGGMSFDNGCTMLGDATGRLVCIETVAGKTDIRDVSGQAFCHANSVLCDELQMYERAELEFPSSPLRQKNMQRLLNAKRGSITVDDLKRFTTDHTNFPLSICRHRSECDPSWTTAAFVADLTGRALHVAIGNPCVAPFKKYDFSPMKRDPEPTALARRAT
jgi:isopenicillin-N N-acyltransferase-like protein